MSTITPTDARTITTSSSTARTLAKVSVGAAFTTAAAIVIAGLVDPGYSARSEAISALASVESKSASIMIFGFVTMALTALSAGTALFLVLKGKAARTGSVLVMIAGVLTLVAGFARQSCSTLQQACLDRESAGTVSGAHVTHNLVSLLLFVLLVAGGFFLSRRSEAQRGVPPPVPGRPHRSLRRPGLHGLVRLGCLRHATVAWWSRRSSCSPSGRPPTWRPVSLRTEPELA